MEKIGIFKIAEPCHENWDKMTAETQGRFCASCQRCVVDFTQKSHAEMKAIYEQEAGDVCGRVRISQVVAPRPSLRAQRPLVRMGALKSIQMFALALLAAFSMMFPSEAQAQKQLMGKVAYVPERTAESEIFGQVRDADGKPASGAAISLSNEDGFVAQTHADGNGMYRFKHLPNGTYSVSASNDRAEQGWGTLQVNGGRPHRQDISMEELHIMGGLRYEPAEPIKEEPIIQKQPLIEEPPIAIDTLRAHATTHTDASKSELLNHEEAILLSGFELKVYPNPASETITLVVDKAGTENLELTLYDINGKVIYEGTWLRFMEPRKTIDIQALPAGIYLLNLRAGDQNVNRQLLKI